MTYLVDANVASELTKPAPQPNVVRWLRDQEAEIAMPIKDSLIAATALVHDLTIATRNVRDFQNAGVRVVDPFAT